MNNRQRFIKAMHFETVDHPPLILATPWEHTWKRWHKEGYLPGKKLEDYFEVEPLICEYGGFGTYLYPLNEEKIIKETETDIIKIDSYGRKVREFKDHTTMPEWLEFPVKSPDDLSRVMDNQLDLSSLDKRLPDDWEKRMDRFRNPEREELVYLDGGCYYWTLRSLAGVEYTSYLFYDAPELIDEFFEKINIICLEGLKRVLPRIKIDYIGFGEDIGYKTSTLISPELFRRFILPRYKKIMELAHRYGVDVTWYDSDGNLIPFMDMYLEIGINGFAPCEVAAGMDPVLLREKYGNRVRMLGGIDKREIAKGREAIKTELFKKVPKLIKQGGYIPCIDHNSISADISLENYTYYVNLLKNIYGI